MAGRLPAGVLCLLFTSFVNGAITPQILKAMADRHGPPLAPNVAEVSQECRLKMTAKTEPRRPKDRERDSGFYNNIADEYNNCKLIHGRFCQTFLLRIPHSESDETMHVYEKHFDCFPKNCSESDISNYAGILYSAIDSTDPNKILAASHCDDTAGNFDVGFYVTTTLLGILGFLVIVGSTFDTCVKVDISGDVNFAEISDESGDCADEREKKKMQKNNNRRTIPRIMVTCPSDSSVNTRRDSFDSVRSLEITGSERQLPPLAVSSISSAVSSVIGVRSEEALVHPTPSESPQRGKERSSADIKTRFPVLCGKSRSFSTMSIVSAKASSVYKSLNFSDPSVFVSPLQTESADLIETLKSPAKIQTAERNNFCCTATPCGKGRRLIEALLGCSASRAAKQIFTSESGGNCFAHIYAMQTVAFWWIILYQTAMYVGTSELLSNPGDFESSLPLKSFQIISNSFLHFHTVFFAGAILDAHGSVEMLENTHSSSDATSTLLFLIGKKFFRQFPSYTISVLIWSFVTLTSNSGPVWNAVRYSKCGSLWWTSMFYISNFYPPNSLGRCMPWTWYISCEMQIYVVGLLMTLLLAKHRRLGVIATIGTVLFMTLLNVYIAYEEKLKASPVVEFYAEKNGSLTVGGEHSSSSFEVLLSKPYFYWIPYAIGLMIGVHMIRQRRISRSLEFTLGVLSAACGAGLVIVIMCGSYFFDESTFESEPLILNLVSMAWVLLLVPIVVYCRYATVKGPLTRLLSSSCWNPIGRLNFPVYVANPIILGYVFFGADFNLRFSSLNLVVYFLSTIVVTYLAVVLTFVVGSNPLHHVLRLLLFHCVSQEPFRTSLKSDIKIGPVKSKVKGQKFYRAMKTSRRRLSKNRSALVSEERCRSFESVFTPVLRTKFASPF